MVVFNKKMIADFMHFLEHDNCAVIDPTTGEVWILYGWPDDLDLDEYVSSAFGPDEKEEMAVERAKLEEVISRGYILPGMNSSESIWNMKRFLYQMDEGGLRSQLFEALQGRRPFANFKAILLDHPKALQAWNTFEEAAIETYVVKTLREMGFEVEV